MDSLNKDILRLSLPAIVSNITVPLLGLCDTAISGHLGSEIFLAAIAVGSVMLNVVFWMFGFLRGGTTGLAAIAFGSKNEKESLIVLSRGFFLGIMAGIFLVILQYPLFRILAVVTGCDQEIEYLVKSYFSIRIWGAPASLATMAVNGWFIGMQTTFFPMIIAIATNLLNISASFILVYLFGWDFQGVAAGTLIADWLGFLGALMCVMLFRKGKSWNIGFSEIFHGDLRKYFSVNGNLFLRSFFIICVTMEITAAGARLGTLILAINVIIMQFFQFFSFFMDGFAFSGEALVGRYIGAFDYPRIKSCVRRLLFWTLGMGIIFSTFYLFGAIPAASVLTDSINVIEGIGKEVLFIALIPIVSCWAFIYDGFYVGLTLTGRMMLSTFLASIIFFLIVFLFTLFPNQSGSTNANSFIWTGFLSYLAIRGIFLATLWKDSLSKSMKGISDYS